MTHPEKPTMIQRLSDFLFGPTRRVREAEKKLEEALKRHRIVRRPTKTLVKETA